ncbi:MAG: DUF2817 domain-containing protein [Acidobacteriia bacterium]|nr:DUF2817 domain-containing protein [Terriglobia bacterium]
MGQIGCTLIAIAVAAAVTALLYVLDSLGINWDSLVIYVSYVIAVIVGIPLLIGFARVVWDVWISLRDKNSYKRSGNRLGHFSTNYEWAKGRFRQAARRAGGRLISLGLAAKGPKGEDLTIDVAWFGSPKPRQVFVHSSGLHGVEAFAGSAIQWQWLKKGMPSLPEHSAIVLVHALNPYGMAWRRRFNENNVDLNRNFREAGDFIPEELPYWDTVNALLNPPTPPGRDRFYLRAAWLVLRYGMPSLRQAIGGGQRLNPSGLFFGGNAMEEGPSKFQDLMKERLVDAERIVAIDVHTGLGRFGTDRLLVDSAAERTEVNRTMREVFGERIEPLAKHGIAYAVRGAQQDMYFRSFPRAKIHFVSQEFGTYNPLRIVEALRAENRWHLYGKRGIRHYTKKALLEVFNPNDPKWRRSVLKRGEEVIQQACALAFGPGNAK